MTTPTVEVDPSARAVYLRFSNNPVFRTLVSRESNPIVTVDIDGQGQLIGVEIVGVA